MKPVAAAPALPEPQEENQQCKWCYRLMFPRPQFCIVKGGLCEPAALPEVAPELPPRPTHFKGLQVELYAKALETFSTNLLSQVQSLKSQLAAAKGGWIDCKQELPPIATYVLLWNGHHRGVGTFSPDDDCPYQFQDESTEFITPDPTHWRPLPTPPDNKGDHDASR